MVNARRPSAGSGGPAEGRNSPPRGVRIRETRKYANLTQEGLAERTELGRSTIQRLEAGRGIKYVHLLVISRALDMALADLVC
ncbi:helix-turn-helix transcriptional regulator [Streptomyces sp. LBL]|uniref:helix-turn-helix domain-containing protein n=1 Tax=Streptomyces sp. LBL TaxID=2940562 RepID=UPI0024752078|nr:helix-turn-helix transcriptional regulator [Streptomyces sp. LBL]